MRQRTPINIFELTADRHTMGDARRPNPARLRDLGQKVRRRLALDGRVGGENHFLNYTGIEQPFELADAELEGLLDSGAVQEMILATNPTVEGEATAHFLSEIAKARGIRATRIAHGVPTVSYTHLTLPTKA